VQLGLTAVRDQVNRVRGALAGQRFGDLLDPVASAVQEHQLDLAAVLAACEQVVDELRNPERWYRRTPTRDVWGRRLPQAR
jgi:ABC-type transporter Mla subunit MlaD